MSFDIGTCTSCERHSPDLRQCERCGDHYHEDCGEFTEIKEGFVCKGCVEDVQSGGDPEWEKKLEGYVDE